MGFVGLIPGAALGLVLLLCGSLGADALYDSSSPVIMLTSTDFKSKVVNSDDLWIVEFFANWCGHCKQFAPEYEKAAKALKGIVKVAAVEDQAVMGEYGVEGFPTVKVFGENKKSPSTYDGARTAAALVDFAMAQATKIAKGRVSGKKAGSDSKGDKKKKGSGASDVIVLTDSNFDKMVMKDEENTWFVEFYAPWCGHCKALAPEWERAATSLKGKVKVAKLDATKETMIAGRFGIQGYPSLKLFPSGKKSEAHMQDYQGPRSSSELVAFGLKFSTANVKAEQILSDEQFNEACEKGLCVVAFLPHILDSSAKQREGYLHDLNAVAKTSVSMPVKFFWSEGGSQFEWEESLRLAFGYPAVVAVNKDKGKYAIHKGDFSQESVKGFLTGLMAGKVPVDPLPANSKIQTVEKWDGTDGQPPQEDL